MGYEDSADHEHGDDDDRGEFPNDRVTVRSVGIDIGSSTMHLAFSELEAERDGGVVRIVDRRVVHLSPIRFTPYDPDGLIDEAAVARFVTAEYSRCEIGAEEIDTGVVILTGVALDRRNSRRIGRAVAELGGNFVSVAAGDELEASLAAHGSGAVAVSRGDRSVLNIDVGGGTTKVTQCERGAITMTAAFDLGTRLIAWDPETRLVRTVEPAGRALAAALGLRVEPGAIFDRESEQQISRRVAAAITSLVGGIGDTLLHEFVRGTIPPFGAPTDVVLSGGVTEYLLGRTTEDHGDLGISLAAALAEYAGRSSVTFKQSEWGIRCTVIGAGQYASQVSGLTAHISEGLALPVRNAQVVALPGDSLIAERVDPDALSTLVTASMDTQLQADTDSEVFAVFLTWHGAMSYTRLAAVASGLTVGMRSQIANRTPLAVACDEDVALLLGHHLVNELGSDYPLIVIDGLSMAPFDFIDIGSRLGDTDSLPVTIKSLAFPPQALQPVSTATQQGFS